MTKITAQGIGTAAGEPDIVTFTVTVQNTGKSLGEARKFNNSRANECVALLKQAIDEKDIVATPPTVRPQWTGKMWKKDSFEATNQISVKVRDIDKLYEIIAGINEIDSDHVSATNVQFAIEDQEALLNEARKAAFEDVKAKAALYATQAGMNLGDLDELNEQHYGGGRRAPSAKFAVASASREMVDDSEVLESGEIELTINLQATFQAGKDVR